MPRDLDCSWSSIYKTMILLENRLLLISLLFLLKPLLWFLLLAFDTLKRTFMAMSLSGSAVLSGIGSSFSSGAAKQSGIGAVGFGRKTEFVVVAQRKKSLIYADKGDGNILDDLNEAT